MLPQHLQDDFDTTSLDELRCAADIYDELVVSTLPAPEHTPGPWVATGWKNTVVNDSQGNTLALYPSHSKDCPLATVQANARLMAASPGLLAVCVKILTDASVTLSSELRQNLFDAVSRALLPSYDVDL